ncbi:YesL family protein [Vagococcus jeotgali]|uniref:YesL family protein n=1 Tax=Vagococcus jeotgali TaxID=3109030 RepID=UPI002DD8F90E|nr:DUF624 domain-containing protein [Vagococcus sp. B2T-5]
MIDKGFKGVWLIVKLNLLFVLFTLCGLVVFGIGAALQMTSDLFQESELDYRKVTFQKAWLSFKTNFLRSNGLFWLYNGVALLLGYNLYLSVQLTGIVWIIINFILIAATLFIFIAYQYVLVYTTNYDIPVSQLIKLSFISIFLSFGSFLKLIFGFVVIMIISWLMKGLFLFATVSLMIAWDNIATKQNRDFVDKRLTVDEE